MKMTEIATEQMDLAHEFEQYRALTRELKRITAQGVRTGDFPHLKNARNSANVPFSKTRTRVSMLARPIQGQMNGNGNLHVGSFETSIVMNGRLIDSTDYGSGIDISSQRGGLLRVVSGFELSLFHQYKDNIASGMRERQGEYFDFLDSGRYDYFVLLAMTVVNNAMGNLKQYLA